MEQPADPRISAALEAAQRFTLGEPRSKLQRVAALDAHRAAKDAGNPVNAHTASAAGDAAASAYLHPFAKGDQVAHKLRSAAQHTLRWPRKRFSATHRPSTTPSSERGPARLGTAARTGDSWGVRPRGSRPGS
ncbi:putative immunity protein [Mariniluteicoccus flavus]